MKALVSSRSSVGCSHLLQLPDAAPVYDDYCLMIESLEGLIRNGTGRAISAGDFSAKVVDDSYALDKLERALFPRNGC